MPRRPQSPPGDGSGAPAAPVEVDPVEVVALLSRPLDQFVAARTARVKELKADGRKGEAAVLAKVRKPVRLVWVVGELARRHPDAAASAASLAEEVEDAMAGGGGVRALLSRFREVVGGVAAHADELGDPIDRLEVGLALREVLADPTARQAWVEGRLLALPGDEPVAVPPDELAARRAARARGGTGAADAVHPSGRGPAVSAEPAADAPGPDEDTVDEAADGEQDEAGPSAVASEAQAEAIRRAEAEVLLAQQASHLARRIKKEAVEAEREVKQRQQAVRAEVARLKEDAARLREEAAEARARVKATGDAALEALGDLAAAGARLGRLKEGGAVRPDL